MVAWQTPYDRLRATSVDKPQLSRLYLAPQSAAFSALSEAMSITKRYFTSFFSIRS